MAFEYLVCQTQYGRVTFVNGSWEGHIALESGDSQAALDSCPQVWEYLARVGATGWELVTGVNTNITQAEGVSQISSQLFFKRQKI